MTHLTETEAEKVGADADAIGLARETYLSAFNEHGNAKDHDIYAAIATAIRGAIQGERERCAAICTDHISVLRNIFQHDVARAVEQVRAEITKG